LRCAAAMLRDRGRLILDLYHRDFFHAHQGQRCIHTSPQVQETTWMKDNRLHVKLQYDGTENAEHFDWRLYAPEELAGLAKAWGLSTVLTCSGFDEFTPDSSAAPRFQIVFEKM